ncbi:hypothetical protein HYU16_01850 [Candidatus Woesearchaeota archaeon]|nr:hypothetical protein [Candidatus Woesearchaeota archaeon]MBI2550171.1 hypothetical protein [Candidatus Woesearchaeota archaeon]
MVAETVIIANFARLLAAIFFLVSAVKMYRISKDTSWDGWNLMNLALALLAINSLLVLLEPFGIYMENIKAIGSVVAGIFAASAFILASRLIKKEKSGK